MKCDYNCSYLQNLRRKCGDADDIIAGCSNKLSFFSGWSIWVILGAISLIILGVAFVVYKFIKRKKEAGDSGDSSKSMLSRICMVFDVEFFDFFVQKNIMKKLKKKSYSRKRNNTYRF